MIARTGRFDELKHVLRGERQHDQHWPIDVFFGAGMLGGEGGVGGEFGGGGEIEAGANGGEDEGGDGVGDAAGLDDLAGGGIGEAGLGARRNMAGCMAEITARPGERRTRRASVKKCGRSRRCSSTRPLTIRSKESESKGSAVCRSCSRKRMASEPGLRRAWASMLGEKSRAVTVAPEAARCRACRPVPQPRSRAQAAHVAERGADDRAFQRLQGIGVVIVDGGPAVVAETNGFQRIGHARRIVNRSSGESISGGTAKYGAETKKKFFATTSDSCINTLPI